MVSYYAITNRKAEPGSSSDLLRGKEGLKYL